MGQSRYEREVRAFAEEGAKKQAARLRKAAMAWATFHDEEDVEGRKELRLYQRFLRAAREYATVYKRGIGP